MNKIIPCNPFTNVAASGLAICDLNNLLGNSLEAINLTLGGGAFTKAMITLVQLKANGKVIWESSGSRIDALELFKGYAANAANLCINFMERSGRTPNAFQSGAIDLMPDMGITNLRLEVTIAGATTPTLSAVAELSPGGAIPGEEAIRPLICRRHAANFTVGAASTKYALPIPHIDPAGGGSVYKRIALFSANLTNIQVVRNGITELDATRADLNQIQVRAGRSPQANLTVWDAILDNVLSNRLWDTRPQAQVQQAIVYGTFSAGETFTIETEELIPFGMY